MPKSQLVFLDLVVRPQASSLTAQVRPAAACIQHFLPAVGLLACRQTDSSAFACSGLLSRVLLPGHWLPPTGSALCRCGHATRPFPSWRHALLPRCALSAALHHQHRSCSTPFADSPATRLALVLLHLPGSAPRRSATLPALHLPLLSPAGSRRLSVQALGGVSAARRDWLAAMPPRQAEELAHEYPGGAHCRRSASSIVSEDIANAPSGPLDS